MKSLIILLVAMCISFNSCSGRPQEVTSLEFSEIEEVFTQTSDSALGYCDVTSYFSLTYFSDIDGVIACKIYKSNDSVNFDEFGIFEFESKQDAEKGQKIVKRYIENAKNEFMNGIVYNPEEYPKFQAADTLVCDKYLIYGILAPDHIGLVFKSINQKAKGALYEVNPI